MKKITLLLLLVISVLGLQAQTYQLNYDSIRVGKTAGTGGTSLYGKVYLKNTTTGLSSDSILVYRGGRIYRIKNTSNINIGSISSTPNSNGISYASDTLKLHAVTATTGGVLTTGTDAIAGDKYFTDQIWITENQQHGGHIGIVSGSGSLMAPLLGSASETSTYWMQILAHPAPNLYNTNPTDGIIFQVYNNEGPDPITGGNAFNFKNGTTSVFNIDFEGDGNLWGGLNMFDNRVSNGGISLGSGSGSLLAPLLSTNSESSTAFLGFAAFPATNIDNTNPTDAFKFNAYKSSDGSQALTGGNLLNLFNKNVSKFSVDYTGVITSAGLTNGLVKSVSGALSNATSGTDYTLLNGTGIVEMAGTTASYLSSTGSGNVVKATSPTLTTPNIGNATFGTLTGGTASTITFANTSAGGIQDAISIRNGGTTAGTGNRINFITGTATQSARINSVLTSSTVADLVFSTMTGGTLGEAGRFLGDKTLQLAAGLTAVGSISSTPQGTLYGTASGSITSAQLATSLTDETGTGSVVFGTSPTLVTPALGNATGGTLSLSGMLTSTQGNNTQIFNSATATTGYQFGRMTNTSGGLLWGIEGSAAGSLLTGGSAYAGVLTTVGSQNLEFGTNQVKAITIDGTTQDATFTGVVKDAGVLHAFASKSANYTLTDNDYYITVTADATITLPSASGRAGKRYVIKAVGAGVDVTISSYTLSGTNENVLILFSDGSSWLTETYISGV
ncbi:MAG TPA: hypothetical protein PLY25_10745 [Bacteroidia bacterium]|nr:hypothetical protein [Bacteroidia bacterium]